MALIEVDGDEFARLQAELNGARNSKTLLDKLGANPKTRQKVLSLMKEADPSLAIPEIDAAQPVLDDIKALREELAAERKAAADEKAKQAKEQEERETAADIDRGRQLLRKRGYQDEGIAKIEEIMQQRRIPDYEAAALILEQTQPKDEPVIPSNMGRSFDMFGAPEDTNDLLKAIRSSSPNNQKALMQWQGRELSSALRAVRAENALQR